MARDHPTHSAESPHDSARPSPEPNTCGFQRLVHEINEVLGPTSGIDSDDVDVEELKTILTEYTSVESQWHKYAFEDASRAYTRNLVDHGNGKSNLLLLVWSPGKGSPVHDHANSHCVMKILRGSLNETLYDWPCGRSGADLAQESNVADHEWSPSHSCPRSGEALLPGALRVRRSTLYHRDQVTYMSDRLGLHRISNPSNDEFAVSLHLYTPPNAAKHGCHIFNEGTGQRHHVQQCHFYSENGVRT